MSALVWGECMCAWVSRCFGCLGACLYRRMHEAICVHVMCRFFYESCESLQALLRKKTARLRSMERPGPDAVSNRDIGPNLP